MSDESEHHAELQAIIWGVAQLRRWSRFSVLWIVAACLCVFVALLFAGIFGSGGASHALSADEAAELRRENAKLQRENDELKRVALAGSAVSAAPAAAIAAKPELIETVIDASVSGATVEIGGTDQTGPAPFIAKLEKGKRYYARISARGYAALEIDVDGGDAKQTAKLVAKPRFVSVTSDPTGAQITIDGTPAGHTPSEIELTSAQVARKSIHVVIRKTGFRVVDRTIDQSRFTEDDTKMLTKLYEKLLPARPPSPDTDIFGPGSP